MTHIEDLVREALAATPATTTTTDPLAALDRRVRRARRRLAVGAGVAAAAVAAAIVVPLAALGGGHDAGKVGVYHPPTPKPSAPAGTSVLWPSGTVWVSADSDGRRWLLYNNGSVGHYYVGRLESGRVAMPREVPGPADYVVAGDNVIWVVGEGPGGSAPSRVSAIDTRTGTVATVTFGQDLSLATTVGDSLYVDVLDNSSGTDSVDRVDLDNGVIGITASVPVPAAGVIATSQQDHVWVQSSTGLVELIPTPTGVDKGVTVGWGGDVYGPTGDKDSMGSDSLWSFDGDRLIGLTPTLLLQGSSVAQGWRLNVAGKPTAVATAADGGLYVAVSQPSKYGKQVGLQTGLAYYSAQDVQGPGTAPTATLAGVQTTAIVADPAGGVDYLDDQGQLLRWDPTAAPAR